MGGAVRLQVGQKQALALTPELVQSIKLLGKSNIELEEFVRERLEENPFLERTRDRMDGTKPLSREAKGNSNASPAVGAAPSSGYTGRGVAHSENTQDFLSQIADERVSLAEYLASQIRLQFDDPEDIKIATQIVVSLDEDGFLRKPIENLAADIGVDLDAALFVLEKVQGFEPAGIATRSLRECFQRQLEDQNRFDSAMDVLLQNLELLAKGDSRKLMRLCKVDHTVLVRMVRDLRGLTPRPAHRFDADPVAHIVPDVVVQRGADEGWKISLNPAALPRVLVNRAYFAEVSKSISAIEDKRFIVDCMNSANWLARSLDQRAQTVLKVATEIVRRQSRFFSQGRAHVQPLSRSEIAEKLGIHESTVGRAVANKFILCSQGVVELSYFFSAAISGTNGETTLSAEAVRHRIAELVRRETATSVMSDDDLADLLRADGVHIARRTVAKYREEMRIPPSSKRRKSLQAGALLS